MSVRTQWLHACNLSDKDNVTHVYICSSHFIQCDYRNNTELCQRKWLLKPGAVPSIGVPNPPGVKLEFQSTSKNVINETQSVPSTDVPHLQAFTAVPNVGKLKFVSISEDVIDEKESVPSTDVPHHQAFTAVPNVEKLEFVSVSEDVIDETHHDDKEQKLYVTPTKKRRFAEPRYISEITVSDFASPKKAQRVIAMVNETYNKKCNLIRKLQKKNRQLCNRIATLEAMLTYFRKKKNSNVRER